MICDEHFELNTQLLLDQMLDSVLVLDEELRIVVFNAAAESMFGYESNEMLGETVLKLITEEARSHVEQFLGVDRSGLLSGKPTELPCVRRDGSTLTIETMTSVLYTDSAEMLLTIARDVTEIKKISNKLAVEHQANQVLLGSIRSLLITINEYDVVENFNDKAKDILGVSGTQVVGRRISDCALGWNSGLVYKFISETLQTKEVSRIDNLEFSTGDGRRGILEITLHPVFDPQTEKYKGVLILGDEVTKQREEAAQDAHIQKLESIGELAAGIAHEINTPIQYIGNNTSFIGDGFGDVMQYVSALENALDGENSGAETDATADSTRALRSELDIDYIAEEIPLAIEQSVAGINRVADIVGAMKTFAHPEQMRNHR